MNGATYCKKKNLVGKLDSSAKTHKKIGCGWVFQHGNDLKHIAGGCKEVPLEEEY